MTFTAVLGDGALVRAALEALIDFLKNFAAPTGARGSVLFMWGGLIIIGFLFLTFLFRSAIVGDLAPIANARAPVPRTLLPGQPAPTSPARVNATRRGGFDMGRAASRDAVGTIDQTLAALSEAGLEVRVLQSRSGWKRLRAYACRSCDTGDADDCEYERGLIAGAFEALSLGAVAKVDEVVCRRAGASHCEFEVEHARLVEVRA